MSVLRAAKPVDQLGQRVDGLAELLALLAQRAQHGVEVDDHLPDELVAVGQRVGQRGGLVQERADGGALALEGRDQLAGQRVDLIGIQRPEQRAEAADQRVEVQGGRGAVEGNRGRPGSSRLTPPAPSSSAR